MTTLPGPPQAGWSEALPSRNRSGKYSWPGAGGGQQLACWFADAWPVEAVMRRLRVSRRRF
jgi:hypothetical protein